MDSHRKEIERLKRANVDLEADRNQIRLSLKQMLEFQMKEALTLLGINKSSIDTNLQSINALNNKPKCHTDSIPIEHMDPKLALLSYDNSIDQLISKAQLNSSKLLVEASGTESRVASKSTQEQPAVNISNINYTRSINETIDSIMREQSIQASTIQTSSMANLIVSDSNNNTSQILPARMEPIKDSYILNQIDLINQYYQIDGKKLVADLSNSNFMEMSQVNKQQELAIDKSLSSSASLSSSSSNLSSENLNIDVKKREVGSANLALAMNPIINRSPKTPEDQTMRPSRVKTPHPPEKQNSKRIEDEILDKSILELNGNNLQNSSTARDGKSLFDQDSLHTFFQKILSITSSSAVVERMWGNIHSLRRPSQTWKK